MLVCERAILRDKVKDKSTENKKQILKFEKNDEKWKGQNERTGIGIDIISKEQRKGKLVMFSSVLAYRRKNQVYLPDFDKLGAPPPGFPNGKVEH